MAIVVGVSGKDYLHVYYEMPLKLVFYFEHCYYTENGIPCQRWDHRKGALSEDSELHNFMTTLDTNG